MPDDQPPSQVDLPLSADTPAPRVPDRRTGGKRQGPHLANRLTALRVKNEKKPGRHPDGGGLYLVVNESGSKQWLLRTVVQGRRVDMGLGGVDLYNLQQARDKARDYRRIAREGGDPLAVRRMERGGAVTFEQAARQVHGERASGWRNAKHGKQWLTTLETFVFPAIGSRRVDQITAADVQAVLQPIWLAKSETARRIRQRIRAVLGWAKVKGLRQGSNPADEVGEGLGVQQDRPQHHPALHPSDVPAFVRDLHHTTAQPSAKLALEFLILTAARTREVLGASVDEFDLQNAIWTVPASRMKGKRPHRIPLSTRALAIVEEAKRLGGEGGPLFPGRRRDDPLSQMALLQLMRRMKSPAVPHGFRATFKAWATEVTPYPWELSELALAHVEKSKTVRAYARTDQLERRRPMMEEWAKWCAPAAGSNVVNLPLFNREAANG